MSLAVCLLASGSKGNAVCVTNGKRALLIDCGISCRQVLVRMAAAGLDPESIEAVVLTHEHIDHTKGIPVLARRLGGLPVLATAGTLAACDLENAARPEPIEAGGSFTAAGITIRAFSVPHNAADPVGLVLESGGARLGLATDLGKVTALVANRLAGCNGLILEHNHDPGLLADGPYPPWLKQRVGSAQGHLSNQQGSELLRRLHHKGLKHVVLAHLSETNNRPELAAACAGGCLAGLSSRARLEVAAQNRPGPVLEI